MPISLRRLTDGSESSDANGGAGVRLKGPKTPPGPMPLLAPRIPPSLPMEEMYESEILPAHLLKDTSFAPQPLDTLMHGRRGNFYTNMTLLKSKTTDSLPAPSAPPMDSEAVLEGQEQQQDKKTAEQPKGSGRSKFKVLFNLKSEVGSREIRSPLSAAQSIYVEPEADASHTPADTMVVEDETTPLKKPIPKKRRKTTEVDKAATLEGS